MTSPAIRAKLIAAGVKNLHEFGYPQCDTATIFTDEIYSMFFKSMLKDNLGQGVDGDINALIAEIEAAHPEPAKKPARRKVKGGKS